MRAGDRVRYPHQWVVDTHAPIRFDRRRGTVLDVSTTNTGLSLVRVAWDHEQQPMCSVCEAVFAVSNCPECEGTGRRWPRILERNLEIYAPK